MLRLYLSNCFMPCSVLHPWTALLVIFVWSNLTLCPFKSWQQPKIIFLPNNVTFIPVKNLLDIEKYLSLRDSQAILAPLESFIISFPNQR